MPTERNKTNKQGKQKDKEKLETKAENEPERFGLRSKISERALDFEK